MARPTKYSTEKCEEICRNLRIGMARRHACQLAGVSDDSLRRWLARHADFAAKVEQAEAHGEALAVAQFRAGAQPWTPRDADGTEVPVLRRVTRRTIVYRAAVRDAAGDPVFGPDGRLVFEQRTESVTDEMREYRVLPPDWRAAAEFLARRFKADWSPRAEITGANSEGQSPVVVCVRGVSLDDI